MNILTNFPYSPFTRKAGSGQRFLQNILGLRDLGHQVTIWSIDHESKYKWLPADLEIAKREGFKVLLTRSWELPPEFLEGVDLVWAIYYNFVSLFQEFEGPLICDSHDLLTCNEQINELFKQKLTKIGTKNTFRYHPEIFEHPVAPFPILEDELNAYRLCNLVVTISKEETERLEKCGITAKWIPYSNFEELPLASRTELPIFGGSANLNNLFGNDYLGEILVPKIRLRQTNFEVQILGEVSDMCFKYPFHKYWGYQSEPDRVYTFSSFGIFPLVYGTGSSVKLMEMLGRGLPVVAFRQRIGDAPLTNETGRPCENVDEFVESSIELWNDHSLRIKLGDNAQEAARNFYSVEKHKQDLEDIINEILHPS